MTRGNAAPLSAGGPPPGLSPSSEYFAGYAWNTVARLGDFGLAYLFGVVLARLLAPHAYGTYASVLSICTLSLVVTSVGIDSTLHRFIGAASAADDSSRRIPSIVRRLLVARIVLLAAVVTVVFALRGWIGVRFGNEAVAGLLGIAVLYIVAQSLVSFVSNVLVGLLRTRIVALLTVAFRAANLLVALILLRTGAGVDAIYLMLGVTSTALLAAYLWKTLPLLTGTGQTIALSPLLSFAAAAWALAAVNFGLGRQSDVILLSALRGDPSEVAIYDVAFTLTQTVGTALTVGLTGVALALFTKRHRTRPEAVGTLWRSFVALVGAAVVPFVALLVVHARSVVAAVYGPAYADAGPILRAYAIPMAVGWMLGGGASSTVLHATFRIRTVLWIRVATGVANVAANVLLIRALGPLGALLGTGVAGASAVIVEFTAVRRVLGERPDLRHVPGVALAAAAALVPSLLARPEGLVELAAHAVLFAAIYLGVLRLVRPLPRLDDGLLAALPSPIARWIGGLISTRAAPG